MNDNNFVTITQEEYDALVSAAAAPKAEPKKVKERKSGGERGLKKQWLASFYKSNPQMIHDRKGAMKAFRDHFGHEVVSEACASTYVANFRSGEWTYEEAK